MLFIMYTDYCFHVVCSIELYASKSWYSAVLGVHNLLKTPITTNISVSPICKITRLSIVKSKITRIHSAIPTRWRQFFEFDFFAQWQCWSTNQNRVFLTIIQWQARAFVSVFLRIALSIIWKTMVWNDKSTDVKYELLIHYRHTQNK